jgi:4,5-DOPA dioxygenase extradiol
MQKLPTYFVSHGAPTMALESSPTADFLDGLAAAMPRKPRAIVVASAHYEASGPRVTAGERPSTIHDFSGFPDALYRLRYDAPGDPALARSIERRLRDAGFDAAVDPGHGFDHGVWVPLRRAFSDATLPVVALSVDPSRDAAWHAAVGRALAPLRDDDVLVVGSGSFVHNLRALARPGSTPPDWAVAFADWMHARLADGELDAATRWYRDAPHATLAHPTPEHLMPLFVAWGAADGARATPLHRDWQFGALAMDALSFG